MGKSLDLYSTSVLKKCSRRKRLPEDRLSSLPDDITFLILSFLTYKEVVKMFLLSSRWLSLRMYFFALHFYEPVPKAVVGKSLVLSDRERRHFVKGVNRVLRKHKTPYLKEFKIICGLDRRNQKDIDRWLVFAFAKKVQCLEINLSGPGENPCSTERHCVFLGRFINYSGKNELSQFDGKCLKSLSLKRVDITSEAIYFFLLNCPFLERLEVSYSMKLEDLVISNPTLVLKYLKIKGCFRLKAVSISNINLVSLDVAYGKLTLANLPMLVELFIHGYDLSYALSQASSCFFQLEALKLRGLKLQDVTSISCYNQLTKLRRLVIEFESSERESLLRLISIINSCPCLEEFVLMLDWIYPFGCWSGRNDGVIEGYRCSSLNNKSLKVFEFVGYRGRVNDNQLIRHVLKKAVGLVKMIIDPNNAVYIDLNALYTRRNDVDTEAEKEARIKALQLSEAFKGYIPPHVEILIR